MSIPVKNKTVIVADVVQPMTKRIYPAEELNNTVAKFNENKGSSHVYGTFYGSSYDETGSIYPDKIVLKIDNLRMDGGALMCDFTMLDTPHGVLMQKYIHDHKFQLAPRGKGKVTVDKDGIQTIRDYSLISVDVKLM